MVLCIHHSINFLKFNIYYYFCHYYVKNLLPTCSPPIPFNAMYKIKTTPFIEGYLLPMSYSSTGTSSHNNIEMEGEVMGSKPTECLCNLLMKKRKLWRVPIYLLVLYYYFCCCIKCEEFVLEDSLRRFWMCISFLKQLCFLSYVTHWRMKC